MHRIRLNEAQADMILAADVANAQQMLLLKKGARLTPQHLRMLKSWGVDCLYVQVPVEDKAERPALMYHALLSIALGAVGTVLFCIYPLVWIYSIYLGTRAYQGQKVSVPFLSEWIAQQDWAKTD